MTVSNVCKVVSAVLVFPAIVGIAPRMTARSAAGAPPTRIEVTAKRFAYVPAEITAKRGEPLVLVLRSQDVAHGVKFDELGVKTEIEKGSSAELAFTPDKAGVFVGHCSHFCGAGHGAMTLTLRVTE